MNLVGLLEGRVVRIDLDHRQQRGERPLEGQQVAELLLDHVADHPSVCAPEHVERIGLDLGCRRRPAAPAGRPAGRCRGRSPADAAATGASASAAMRTLRALVLGGHGLAAAQQRVAAQGGDDQHGSVSERGDQDRLDRVHPVLGLLERDVGFGLEHVVGDLEAVR